MFFYITHMLTEVVNATRGQDHTSMNVSTGHNMLQHNMAGNVPGSVVLTAWRHSAIRSYTAYR